jgi:hypothetical protein
MPDRDEVLLDWAWRNIDEFWDDKRELDNKGSILLTANGIVLGFVANAFSKLYYITSLLGIIFLVVSIILCILLLKPHVYIRSMCEPHELMCKLNGDQLNRKLYNELKGVSQENKDTIKTLVKWYNRAIYSFLAALILIAISIVMPYTPFPALLNGTLVEFMT